MIELKYHDDGGTQVLVTTDVIYLPSLLEVIDGFLYAAGFRFNGHLEFVDATKTQEQHGCSNRDSEDLLCKREEDLEAQSNVVEHR